MAGNNTVDAERGRITFTAPSDKEQGSVVKFSDDATYRLTKEKRSTTNTYWYEYLYDNGGNRTKFIQKDTGGNQTGSKGYAYDAANKLTLEGDLSNPNANGNIQYTYDSNGSLTKKAIGGMGTSSTPTMPRIT